MIMTMPYGVLRARGKWIARSSAAHFHRRRAARKEAVTTGETVRLTHFRQFHR